MIPPLIAGQFILGDPLVERDDDDIQICEATHRNLVQELVVKLQKTGPKATLRHEIDIYKLLMKDSPTHLPQVLWLGTHDGYHSIVMKKYEVDLRNLFRHSILMDEVLLGCLSLFAVDMVAALHYIHSKEIIHCDIRPDNFMLGQLWNGYPGIILIDFEASVVAGQIREGEVEHRGDLYFASPHFLRNRQCPCKGDDLISLAYVLAFIARRSQLPWDSGLLDIAKRRPFKNAAELDAACLCIADLKSQLSDRCFDGLPLLFRHFYESAAQFPSLPFDYMRYIDDFNTLSDSYAPAAKQLCE